MAESAKRPGVPTMMAALVAAFCLIQVALGERSPWEGGLPGDSRVYAPLTVDFPGSLLGKKLDAYYIQRVLPAAVVHFGLRLAGLPLDARGIIGAFLALNSACLIAAAYLWGRAAGRLGLPPRLAWLGLAALVLNVGVGYHSFSQAVSTDPSAFLVGMALLDRYAARDSAGLLAVGAVGAFVWPTALVTCLVLHVFDDRTSARPGRADRFIAAAIALAYGAAVVGWFALRQLGRGRLLIIFGATPAVESTLILGLACLLLQFSLTCPPFLNMISYVSIPKLFRTRRMAAAIAVYVAVRAVQAVLANREPTYGIRFLFNGMWSYAVARPMIAPIAHAVYYGPVICTMVLWWGSLARAVRLLGRGFPPVLAMTAMMAIGCESRTIILQFPFLVAAAMKALDGPGWGRRGEWLLVFLGFVSSKVWLRYVPQVRADPAGQARPCQEFPLQYTHMSLGPWISNTMYLAQGLAVILALLAFAILSLAEERRPVVAGDSGPSPLDHVPEPAATCEG